MASFTLAAHYVDSAVDTTGRPLIGTPVSVFLSGTQTLATLYTDSTKATVAPNPTTTTSEGNLDFFVAPGPYDLVATIGGVVQPKVTVVVDPDPVDVLSAINQGVSGVASFNTRTGAVTLATADVTGTGVTLDQIAAPAANVAMNAKKITGLANGTASSDAAAFGQIPTNVGLQIENLNPVTMPAGGTQAVPDVTSDTMNVFTFGAGNATLTFPTAANGKSFLLALVQDATGSRTVTWPANIKWPSATPPVLTTVAAKMDIFEFFVLDGTNWVGITVAQNV